MNDSFLEDLELVPVERKAAKQNHAERNITRRSLQSPVNSFPDQEELNDLLAKQNVKQKVTSALTSKVTCRKSDGGKESRPTSREGKLAETLKPKSLERKTKPTENKLKPVENVRHRETTAATKNGTKERSRWSEGSNKESSRCSDGSSKENSRPSDSSRENASQLEPTKDRIKSVVDGVTQKKDSVEKFEVAMLNSVKEIVSAYTKNESTKILRAMQELYINSQANLIKLMIQQTDDIVNEAHSNKESPRVRSLMEENLRLKENIAILEARNEEFKKTLEESEQIKQENLQLKLRCNELLKSSNSMERRSDGTPGDSVSNARRLLELCRNSK